MPTDDDRPTGQPPDDDRLPPDDGLPFEDLLDVMHALRELWHRHKNGLATRAEALTVKGQLDGLSELGYGMDPLAGRVTWLLGQLPERTVGIIWRPAGADPRGTPPLLILRLPGDPRTTLSAASTVSPSALRAYAEQHLDPDEMAAYPTAFHQHSWGLAHQHPEVLHLEREQAVLAIRQAVSASERTRAVRAFQQVAASHDQSGSMVVTDG